MNDRTRNSETSDPTSVRGDYLWDRSGAPDPAIIRLERVLGSLRYRPSTVETPPSRRFRPFADHTPLAAAASLAVTIGVAWLASQWLRADEPHASMPVRVVEGSTRIGAESLETQGVLRAGQWLETGVDSTAELNVASIGRVTVEPGSRVRLVTSHQAEHRLELARGGIEAFITAPPRLFFVDTPSATAVDLGCRYRLQVDEAGSGVLDVMLGWVSLEWRGRESIVPAGVICLMRPGAGPGTPFQRDAPALLVRELERFDFESGGMPALDAVLREANDDDSVTLWHLMQRAPAAKRAHIVDRLESIQPMPAGVARSEVIELVPKALERWRQEFTWSPIAPISGQSK